MTKHLKYGIRTTCVIYYTLLALILQTTEYLANPIFYLGLVGWLLQTEPLNWTVICYYHNSGRDDVMYTGYHVSAVEILK